MKKIYTLSLLLAALLLAPLAGFAQFKIPEKPSFQTSVYDYASLMSADEKSALEEKLVRYSDSTSTQIVVATVENLSGESAARVAPDWAQQWGIGQAKEDNGIFILVAKKERDMYIATGYGVQGRLPAGTVGTIIRSYITPEFKTGDYYSGLDKGSDAIFKALNGKFKGERVSESKNNDGWFAGLIPFAFILIIVIFIIARRGGGGGGNRGGGGFNLLDVLILSSLGSSGRSSGGGWGGGSSGGGGGFGGGFGGGGFSGGGAGGSW